MITSKKIGRVKISLELINDLPEAVQLVMSAFIPIKADIFPEGWIEYIGISDYFEDRKDGLVTPQYDFIVVNDQEKGLFIKEVIKV